MAQQDLVAWSSLTSALGQVGPAGLPSMVSESVFRPWPCPSLVAVCKLSLPPLVSHHGACPGPPARCLVHLVLGGKSSNPEIRLPLQARGQRKDMFRDLHPPPLLGLAQVAPGGADMGLQAHRSGELIYLETGIGSGLLKRPPSFRDFYFYLWLSLKAGVSRHVASAVEVASVDV